MPCPHLRIRVEDDPDGEPVAQHCEACGRRRSMRPLSHLHYNEDTDATGRLSEEQVQAGQMPVGSIIIETEFAYGPWVEA